MKPTTPPSGPSQHVWYPADRYGSPVAITSVLHRLTVQSHLDTDRLQTRRQPQNEPAAHLGRLPSSVRVGKFLTY